MPSLIVPNRSRQWASGVQPKSSWRFQEGAWRPISMSATTTPVLLGPTFCDDFSAGIGDERRSLESTSVPHRQPRHRARQLAGMRSVQNRCSDVLRERSRGAGGPSTNCSVPSDRTRLEVAKEGSTTTRSRSSPDRRETVGVRPFGYASAPNTPPHRNRIHPCGTRRHRCRRHRTRSPTWWAGPCRAGLRLRQRRLRGRRCARGHPRPGTGMSRRPMRCAAARAH